MSWSLSLGLRAEKVLEVRRVKSVVPPSPGRILDLWLDGTVRVLTFRSEVY